MKLNHLALFLLTVLVGTCAILAAPAPPPRPWYQGWDKPVDPDRSCKFVRNGKVLTITVPGPIETMSADWFLSKKTPRLLRDVSGDFSVEVRVSGDFAPSELPLQGESYAQVTAGLVLMRDRFTLAAVRRASMRDQDGTSTGVNSWISDNKGEKVNVIIDGPPRWPLGRPMYLRLRRTGDRLTAAYSADGKVWEESELGKRQFPANLKLGVFATTNCTGRFTLRFDELKLAPRGKKGG